MPIRFAYQGTKYAEDFILTKPLQNFPFCPITASDLRIILNFE